MSADPNDLGKLSETKVGWKEAIPTGQFLGFIFGCIMFLLLGNRVTWYDWNDTGFLIVVWLIVFSFLLLFGWTKPSFTKITKLMASILYDPMYKQQTKFSMLSSLLWTIFGVTVNMSKNEEKTGLTELVRTMGNKLDEIKTEPKPLPGPFPAPIPTPPKPEEKK